MPTEIKMWQIEDESPKPVDTGRLDLEARLEDWIEKDISLISDDLIVIGRQVGTGFGGEIDLLAVDRSADLAILELKRDRTPREVVAQVLDYASWVESLGYDGIKELATKFYGGWEPFEKAFIDRFGDSFPDTVNSSHSMYIVASSLDPATERIVEYLSGTHGVNINAALFSYFKTESGEEMIGRSMLREEDDPKPTGVGSRSKRRRIRPLAELQAEAEDNGVGELWQKAANAFREVSQGRGNSDSSLFFWVRQGSRTRSFVSMFPSASSPEDGLAISLIFDVLTPAFNLTEDKVRDVCGLSEDLRRPDVGIGIGYLFDEDRLDKFIALLRRNAPQG